MLKYFTQFVVVLVAGFFLKHAAAAHQEPVPKERLDLHGDPLPEGAIARLGTSRWRLRANMITYSPDGENFDHKCGSQSLFKRNKWQKTREFSDFFS